MLAVAVAMAVVALRLAAMVASDGGVMIIFYFCTFYTTKIFFGENGLAVSFSRPMT